MFENLTNRLNQVFDQLRRRGKLTEADVDVAMREVRLALLEADVHFSVVKSFIARVRERAIGAEVSKARTPSACHYAGRLTGLRQDHGRRQAGASASLERRARHACRRGSVSSSGGA